MKKNNVWTIKFGFSIKNLILQPRPAAPHLFVFWSFGAHRIARSAGAFKYSLVSMVIRCRFLIVGSVAARRDLGQAAKHGFPRPHLVTGMRHC